ncbi:hypothetical protein FOCC_FOCC007223 [Frankliniella occidentalis]|nr:hypothetical protein FOCC_FOCC007223 [Frankliniella occidentalis]
MLVLHQGSGHLQGRVVVTLVDKAHVSDTRAVAMGVVDELQPGVGDDPVREKAAHVGECGAATHVANLDAQVALLLVIGLATLAKAQTFRTAPPPADQIDVSSELVLAGEAFPVVVAPVRATAVTVSVTVIPPPVSRSVHVTAATAVTVSVPSVALPAGHIPATSTAVEAILIVIIVRHVEHIGEALSHSMRPAWSTRSAREWFKTTLARATAHPAARPSRPTRAARAARSPRPTRSAGSVQIGRVEQGPVVTHARAGAHARTRSHARAHTGTRAHGHHAHARAHSRTHAEHVTTPVGADAVPLAVKHSQSVPHRAHRIHVTRAAPHLQHGTLHHMVHRAAVHRSHGAHGTHPITRSVERPVLAERSPTRVEEVFLASPGVHVIRGAFFLGVPRPQTHPDGLVLAGRRRGPGAGAGPRNPRGPQRRAQPGEPSHEGHEGHGRPAVVVLRGHGGARGTGGHATVPEGRLAGL